MQIWGGGGGLTVMKVEGENLHVPKTMEMRIEHIYITPKGERDCCGGGCRPPRDYFNLTRVEKERKK